MGVEILANAAVGSQNQGARAPPGGRHSGDVFNTFKGEIVPGPACTVAAMCVCFGWSRCVWCCCDGVVYTPLIGVTR